MGTFATIVSVCSGCVTVLGFIGIFVKYGNDKGEAAADMREMRKDIDHNAKDIDALGTKVNNIQLENAVQLRGLSSDMGWIRSALEGISKKLDQRGSQNA